MAENGSGKDKSVDLRNELRLLKMNLERSNMERASAAEYGLAILEEKNALKSRLEQKEASVENLKAQLACAQESLITMQQHNKALEEADIAEEERRMIQEELMKREKDDLENELRNCRKQLCHIGEEKEKVEDLLKQSYALNEITKAQLKKTKEDLKECESKESFALKNCDTLESDNLELQLQVSQLLKSLQHFDATQSENRRLLEKVEELSLDAKRMSLLKAEMERSLQETNDMLKDEREMKMRYKRELDSRILSDEGTFLNASTVASLHSLLSGPSSMVGDVSVDNISTLLDGFMVFDDDSDKGIKPDDQQKSVVMSDSLEDLATSNENDLSKINNGNKINIKRRNRKSLMSELMMTHEEYVANIEQLEFENLRLNKNIEDLQQALNETENKLRIEDQFNDQTSTMLQVQAEPVKLLTATLSSETQTETTLSEENMEDAIRCLQNLRLILLDMVTEAQSTYTTLCNAGEESLNSKAMIHVDARKASVMAKIGRSEGDVSKGHIPSFVLSKSLPKSPVAYESIWVLEVDCTKLLASSIDLMRYSRRVANRMLDTKMAIRARESPSSLMSSSLASSFSNCHFVGVPNSTSSSNFETQEQIIQLQSLLAAKTEQMMSLRQMLAANKSVYESSIEKLKQQHDNEMTIKIRMIEDLKRIVDELRGQEGIKFASEQTLIKQCDQYSSQMDDLQERLTSSELERKTLNSLLRIAIQHKLLLLKKLQNHGISVDLFSEQSSDAVSHSEQKRDNMPSPRPPMRSRLLRSPTSTRQKPSSFTPLLYGSTRNK